MYDTQEEARMRLGACIILWRDEPVYVQEVITSGKRIVLAACKLPFNERNGHDYLIDIEDKDINCRDYRGRVGYMNNIADGNGRTFAGYFRRMPVRGGGYKQGVTWGNLQAPRGVRVGAVLNYSGALRNPAFKDMFLGKYPTYAEARDILNADQNVTSVAFSPVFALQKDQELGFFILLYRGERIAHGDPEGLTLPSHKAYLAEVVNESGVHIR